MKPATISIVSVAGTLGIIAAIGFAQPDGIDPPAGPVVDTQPSLASIDQRLASIQNTLGEEPWEFLVIDTNTPSATITGSRIQLGRVILSRGSLHISNSTDFDFTFVSSREVVAGSYQNNEPIQYDLNFVIDGPVSIENTSASQEGYIVLYRVAQ